MPPVPRLGRAMELEGCMLLVQSRGLRQGLTNNLRTWGPERTSFERQVFRSGDDVLRSTNGEGSYGISSYEVSIKQVSIGVPLRAIISANTSALSNAVDPGSET